MFWSNCSRSCICANLVSTRHCLQPILAFASCSTSALFRAAGISRFSLLYPLPSYPYIQLKFQYIFGLNWIWNQSHLAALRSPLCRLRCFHPLNACRWLLAAVAFWQTRQVDVSQKVAPHSHADILNNSFLSLDLQTCCRLRS